MRCKVCESLSDHVNEIQCDMYNQKAGTRALVDEMLQEITSIKGVLKEMRGDFNVTLVDTVRSAVHDYVGKQANTLKQTISKMEKAMQSLIKQVPSTMQKQNVQLSNLESEMRNQKKILADMNLLTELEKRAKSVEILRIEVHNLRRTMSAQENMIHDAQHDFMQFQQKTNAKIDDVAVFLDGTQLQVSMLESRIETQCQTITNLENKLSQKNEQQLHLEKKIKSQDVKIKILQEKMNKLITVVNNNRKPEPKSQTVPPLAEKPQKKVMKTETKAPTKGLVIKESKFTAYSNKKQLPHKFVKKNIDCSRVVLKYNVDKLKDYRRSTTKTKKPVDLFEIPN
ncbi:hypothetical protein ACO0QE_000374 [Hanseniaspora vineae]